MMGKKERSFAQLIHVSLEELVPQDHFYRHLDRTLDLSLVRDLVQETYASLGRPSIDPVVFFKLQLVMFFEDIRSERLLMRLVADRLSVRWYIGYDLDEPLPDHSSLSKIRMRYGLPVFRRFFEAIVQQCREAKLVWGKELYFDSTQVNANAALDSLTARFALEAREAIQQHLAILFAGEEAKPENAEESHTCDAPLPENIQGTSPSALSAVNAAALLEECEADTMAKPENSQQSSSTDKALPNRLAETISSPSPTALSPLISTALQEEMAATTATRHDWIAQAGRQQREVAGKYQRTADLRISTTDPDATPMRLKGGGVHLGYHTHYVVDGGKSRIILAVLVVPGEVMDNQPMLDLLWHVCFRWQLRPRQVTGDTKYATIKIIKALEDAHIRAYVPLPDWEHITPYYGPAHFTYDAANDLYWCPQEQPLRPFCRSESREQVGYRADPATCNTCPVKAKCTESGSGRQLHRSFHADYLERVKGYHQTFAYQKAMNKRQVWVEPLFAEAKQWHRMRCFRLRRLWRVNGEALVTASGQNLKRLLRKRGWGRRPFPTEAVATPARGKADQSPRHDLLKSRASLWPLWPPLMPQTSSLLSRRTSFLPLSLFYTIVCFLSKVSHPFSLLSLSKRSSA